MLLWNIFFPFIIVSTLTFTQETLKDFLNLNSVVPLLPFDFSWRIVSPFSVSFYFFVIFLPFFFCLGLISGPQSYLTSFPNVYVAASETQFYKQCFPRGSIQFGLFSVALHWLSQKPCSVTGGLLCSWPKTRRRGNFLQDRQQWIGKRSFWLKQRNCH